MRFSLSGRTLMAALVVVAAAMVGGIAYAAIPDSGGVIHGCYSANGANGTNGTELSIINRDSASCGKGKQEITWSQTGPRGPAGKDGASVTNTSLSPADTRCSGAGGSQFTVGESTTYACNGIRGDRGDKGDQGDKGDTGPAGSSTAYTNYGSGLHHLATGTTQTVASVTLPAGSYTLSATAAVVKDAANAHVQCFFLSAGALHGSVALASLEGTFQVRMPIIGDVTITTTTASVFLRCSALDAAAEATGDMIATQVAAITPSE